LNISSQSTKVKQILNKLHDTLRPCADQRTHAMQVSSFLPAASCMLKRIIVWKTEEMEQHFRAQNKGRQQKGFEIFTNIDSPP
jgi:hypothetical protein